MKSGYRITKAEFYRRGGLKNSSLFTGQGKDGRKYYYASYGR